MTLFDACLLMLLTSWQFRLSMAFQVMLLTGRVQ